MVASGAIRGQGYFCATDLQPPFGAVSQALVEERPFRACPSGLWFCYPVLQENPFISGTCAMLLTALCRL
jgi:hypothetical protein